MTDRCAHCGEAHEGLCDPSDVAMFNIEQRNARPLQGVLDEKRPGQQKRFGRTSTPAERIQRLRDRLREVKPPNAPAQLVGVLQGVLDLLADEL